MQVSKINTIITLDYLTKNAENLYFERKQGKVSNADKELNNFFRILSDGLYDNTQKM